MTIFKAISTYFRTFSTRRNLSEDFNEEDGAFRQALKVNCALFTAVLLWSSSFVGIRIGLESFSPGSLAFFRFFIASACFALFLRKSSPALSISASQLKLLIFVGVFGVAGYAICLNNGEKSVSSGLASFIVAQTPVVTAILAMTYLRERPAWISLLGIGTSCVGIGLILLGQSVQLDLSFGLLLLLCATICGSLHSIFQRVLLRNLSPYLVTTFSTWAATLALAVFLPNLIAELKLAHTSSIAAALFLGVVPSTIGQWLWCYGLSKTLVVRASAYLYTMPILSTFFGWLVLSEVPGLQALIGGSIALLGAILVKKELAPEPDDEPKGEQDHAVKCEG